MAAGYTCPVCDYPKLSEPPRSEFGGGSFEICPSCGFQFGVNDDDEGISYETWRRRWEASGMPWVSIALKKPDAWKPVAKYVAPGGAALQRPGDPTPATATATATPSSTPPTEEGIPKKTSNPSPPTSSKSPAPAAKKAAAKKAAPAARSRNTATKKKPAPSTTLSKKSGKAKDRQPTPSRKTGAKKISGRRSSS